MIDRSHPQVSPIEPPLVDVALPKEPDIRDVVRKMRTAVDAGAGPTLSALETSTLLRLIGVVHRDQLEAIRRAFVDGVVWWQGYNQLGEMFSSEQADAEVEATKRYGRPRCGCSHWRPWPQPQASLPASPAPQEPREEVFTADQVESAVRDFLQWGEDAYRKGHQGGYFSGNGWAARALRFHLAQLTAAPSVLPQQDLHSRIMNLQCQPPADIGICLTAYKIGHRDARHTAAELVAGLPPDPSLLIVRESTQAEDLSRVDGERLSEGQDLPRQRTGDE